ncbi:hypothetical protein ACS0PU_004226 [Formica fusca]
MHTLHLTSQKICTLYACLQFWFTKSYNIICLCRDYINKCASTNEADDSESQIKTLKAENERLTALVQSLRDNHIKQLQNQADMFQHLLREQKDFMKNKLTAALTKVKLMNPQKQRLNVKMTDLLKDAKSKKILHEESYDILSSEFKATFKYILQNEKLNKNKACYGRRYNEEVKKFAITLYYHSPKAYDFYRWKKRDRIHSSII